ncbi:MAG TPA: 3'-5' exonuclease, partial [Halococcus sp.]|nr:3'-5' exonuclease [Halococcus sp.]
MSETGDTEQATLLDNGDSGAERSAAAVAAHVAGDGGRDAELVDPTERRYPETDGTVEIAVTQVDYTVEGTGERETPIIHVFGRTSENNLEHIRVHDFRPYFYAPTATLSEDTLQIDRLTGWEETGDDGEPYESIRGEKLTKIFGQTPRDVGQMRERFSHYEADILFPNRFLIDKDIRSGLKVPERRASDDALVVPHDEVEPIEMQADARVSTFDIEVDDRSGFPEDGEEKIICLSSHDSRQDEYAVWLYEAPDGAACPDELAGYEGIESEFDAEVHRFSSEEAMLAGFLDYVEKTDPDILTGWNFADFDAPYLLDRLEVLGGSDCEEFDLDPNRLSRVNEVWRSDWQGPNIKGRVVFDLLYAYQRTQFSELDSYRLDAVGEVELGVGKERYAGAIGDLWEQNPERLLEYNLRDVELCVEIDRRQGVIPFWQEVASFVGCKLEDATTPGDAVDMYVLHNAYGNFALPSKGQQETEEFEGGAVFDPITGVRENVAVLDLASLYPMSMVTINASPETKVDADYDGETYRAPNGQRFRKKPDGIMREM